MSGRRPEPAPSRNGHPGGQARPRRGPAPGPARATRRAIAEPSGEQTAALLAALARQVHGADATVIAWTARPVSKRGRRRAVRYDLAASVTRGGPPCRFQWVGKFYERAAAGRKVAAVLRDLEKADLGARGGLVLPRVLTYRAGLRLLVLTYEPGESIVAALGRGAEPVLSGIGRALAALHGAGAAPGRSVSAAALLEELRPRVAELSGRWAGTEWAGRLWKALEQGLPGEPGAAALLHGDLGSAQLLWQTGRVVLLDLDDCARGDPALDLGHLLAQWRRLELRKPGKLPPRASLRSGLLDAYIRRAAGDVGPDLDRRVTWYERATWLRKIHFLATDTARHGEPGALRARHAEAARMLREVPGWLRPG